jgi:SAM-dependent methyltransferase
VSPGLYVHVASWETAYPVELIRAILDVKGPGWVCDEIMREESPRYVEWTLRHMILGVVDEGFFDGKRLLDFGCGVGASTVILARMFSGAEIVAVELEESLLAVARRRAAHYGLSRVRLVQSPSGLELPQGIGEFDAVVMSGVYEHLMPDERQFLMPRVWSVLRPGGVLFLTMPWRYFPVEGHTSGLPLVNYLPARLAMAFAKRFSPKVPKDDTWQDLLRRGIRGGTAREVLKVLRRQANGRPALLEPCRLGLHDRVDLWYAGSTAAGSSTPKRVFRALAKAIRKVFSVEFVPQLALAIRKDVPCGPTEGGALE